MNKYMINKEWMASAPFSCVFIKAVCVYPPEIPTNPHKQRKNTVPAALICLQKQCLYCAFRGSNPGRPAASPLRKEVLAHRTVRCIQLVFKQLKIIFYAKF